MNAIEFFLEHYGNHLPLSETNSKLPLVEKANACLSNNLPWQALDKKTQEWVASPKKRHSAKGVSKLIITPRGYYSNYRILNNPIPHLGIIGKELIADWDILVDKEKPAKFEETALAKYLKNRDLDEAFMVLLFNDKKLDVRTLKISLDTRYVVINYQREPSIYDLAHLLKQGGA